MNGVRGLEFRIGFEVVAEKNESDDEGCAVEEHVACFAYERRQEGQQRGKGHQGRPQHGHRGAEVHQHVHVGGSTSQGRPGVSVKVSARQGVDRQGGEHGEGQSNIQGPE